MTGENDEDNTAGADVCLLQKGGFAMMKNNKTKSRGRKGTFLFAGLLALCLCAGLTACGVVGGSDSTDSSAAVSTSGGGTSEQPAGIESIAISNESALTAEWNIGDADRTVHVTFAPEGYTEENTDFEVTSSDPAIIAVAGKSLQAVGAGTATITVTAGTAVDTVEITVSVGEPELIFYDDSLSAVEDEVYYLDELVYAEAHDGATLTNEVEVTTTDESILYDAETGELCFTEKGTHELTFSVSDPRDETKTASETVVFTVVRNPVTITNTNFNMSDMYGAEADQTLAGTDGSLNIVYAYFNAEPSKLYYAEATFDIGSPHQGVAIGLGHLIEGDTTRMISMSVDRGDRNFKIKDIDWVKTPNPALLESSWSAENPNPTDIYAEQNYALYSYRVTQVRGYEDADASHVKFAVARVGDMFYAFLNDQYIGGVSFEYYADKDTVPGLIGTMWNTVEISGMSWLSGEEAQTKIDALTAGQELVAYAPDTWAAASATNFETAVENLGRDENGIKFDFTDSSIEWNYGAVSPYVWFDGDFSVEWVYKNTEAGNETFSQAYLEVRDWKYGAPVVKLGEDISNGRFMLDLMPEGGESAQLQQPAFGEFDFTQGTRYTVSRIMGETSATYILTVTSVANPEQTFSRVVEYAGNRWNEPVLFMWHNLFTSGSYSGISWTTDVTVSESGTEEA